MRNNKRAFFFCANASQPLFGNQFKIRSFFSRLLKVSFLINSVAGRFDPGSNVSSHFWPVASAVWTGEQGNRRTGAGEQENRSRRTGGGEMVLDVCLKVTKCGDHLKLYDLCCFLGRHT